MTMAFDFDAAVTGAGAVGLACAYRLAAAGRSVVVLEKERRIGQGVSSRNSEVVHAGLYYPTGSLRAELCARGRRLLYPFLQKHGVAHERCGKIVVATSEAEVSRLEAVARQAEINGVEGLRLLTAAEVHAMEPQARAVAGLWSRETGILDSHGYMLALQGEIEARGGVVATGAPFDGAEPLAGGGFAVRVGGGEPAVLRVRQLVVAAGLGAQAAAGRIEGYPPGEIPPLYYGKGVYFALNGPAPFHRLVYPPPVPGALGVHYTRDLAGRAQFGPDLEFVEAEDYGVDPGRAAAFYDAVRRFWPAVPDGALVPAYAGIRPKLHGPGEPQADFRIDGAERHGLSGLVTLFGIESPGLTSSLAIGDRVAGLLSQA